METFFAMWTIPFVLFLDGSPEIEDMRIAAVCLLSI
jgi:hypothetical protein